ncbi:transposase [Mycobacterium sp. SM1]|uniref:transposase n=1 Tax=Mycobacterium sp. SM1 TaxID=2816243 RepID=UPI001BCD1CE3|nr:transposase [Mycobacterium sp. SM1]MBS4730516.1 transposase [Mycobacterium sp. SM1]
MAGWSRNDGMNDVTVQTMGVHYRWAVPDVLSRQLRLAHDLREDLVSLQLSYEDDIKRIWSSYPAVRSAEERVALAQEQAAAASDAVKAARIAARGKRVDSALTQHLRDARAALKAARQHRLSAIAEVKDAAMQRIRDRGDQLIADQKALYQRYCQQSDLYWATFNTIVDQHRAAVRRIKQLRAQGRPAMLRHHRFDGTGTIAVQLQRQADMPPRTPALLADATGRYRNVLHLPWIDPKQWADMTRAEQRRAGRVEVRMRCGSRDGQPQWITVPVQAHRWLPADADISGAKLTISRVGADLRGRLSITASIPAPATMHDDESAVAIHLGWLNSDTGTIVAHWRANRPLAVPPGLANVMVPITADGLAGRIIAPASIAARLRRHSQTASERYLALDGIRGKLVDWLHEHGPQPHPTREGEQITAAAVARWRSPAQFAALALAWRDSSLEIAAALEAWRRADRLLWQQQAHGRCRALGHRDDLWRQVAHTVVTQYRRIIVDDTNVADLIRGIVERSDFPNEIQREIDRRRDHAAPGTLRTRIIAAAERDGVAVTVVPAAGLSRIHARCGHENPADDRYWRRPVTCDGCGKTYDPDLSATATMLARALQSPHETVPKH